MTDSTTNIMSSESNNNKGRKWQFQSIFTSFPNLDTLFFEALKDFGNKIGGVIATSYLISILSCLLPQDEEKIEFVSALLIGVGFSSILLSLFTNRYKINASYRTSILICASMILQTKDWECPGTGDLYAMGECKRMQHWKLRINELQGIVILLAFLQLPISLIGKRISRFIRPVSIAPTLIILGLSVVKLPIMKIVSVKWPLFVSAVIILSIMYCISNSSQDNRFTYLFPSVIGVGLIWITWASMLKFGFLTIEIEEDINNINEVFDHNIRFPLFVPVHWGLPTLSLKTAFIVIPILVISLMDRLADSHIRSKNENESNENIEKLIYFESISCIVSSVTGACFGFEIMETKKTKTSFTLGRKIFQIEVLVGILLVIAGSVVSFCAFILIIPEALVSSLLIVVYLSAVLKGISVTRLIKFDSNRNVYIVAISLFLGIIIPHFIAMNNLNVDSTKNKLLTSLLFIFMTNGPLITGFSAIMLDYIIPEYYKSPSNEPTSSDDMNRKVEEPYTEKESFSFLRFLSSIFE